jgi:hypothetical protein
VPPTCHPTPGPTITQISASTTRELAGLYVEPKGVQQGFVTISSVPEPGSLALLGLGMTLAAGYSARRAHRGRPTA